MLLLRGSLGLQHHRNVLHLHQRSARCPATTARKELVTIAYDDLLNHPERISDSIAAAFGPTGLGFLTVRGVPGFSEARQELLPLAWRLASLPQASLRKLEDSASNFAFGWSHGKEKLVGNKPDVSKGSFYANPMVDRVPATPADRVACPSMLRDNVWPEDDLPELRNAFMSLGGIVVATGILLARACDSYVAVRKGGGEGAGMGLEEALRASMNHKGRLLHYFPPQEGAAEDWCAVHTDHGSLTGLTSAIYQDGEGRQVPNPDPSAGLWIRAPGGEWVQGRIPTDHVGFQVGESAEIASGGLLKATPHVVRAPGAAGVSRSTMAVFMQPAWDARIAVPGWATGEALKVGSWREGMTFAEFSEATYQRVYG